MSKFCSVSLYLLISIVLSLFVPSLVAQENAEVNSVESINAEQGISEVEVIKNEFSVNLDFSEKEFNILFENNLVTWLENQLNLKAYRKAQRAAYGAWKTESFYSLPDVSLDKQEIILLPQAIKISKVHQNKRIRSGLK